MINPPLPPTEMFDGAVRHAGQTLLTVAFCLHAHNEYHEQYIALFLRLCTLRGLHCKALRLSPLDLESSIESISHIPLALIVCLDNQYAALMLLTRAKLHISAPLVFVDLDLPKALPIPLPAKCICIATDLTTFVSDMCSLIPTIQSIHTVGILYDQTDQILTPLLPEIVAWLEKRDYVAKAIVRKPTITSADVLVFGSCDMLIFLSRSAPEDYQQRLATVCKQQHTMLYATTPSALSYGASFVFTPNMHHMADEAVSVLSRYLSTNTVSPTIYIGYQLLINSYEVANNKLLAASLNLFMTLSQTITIATPTTPEKVSAYLRLEQIPLE